MSRRASSGLTLIEVLVASALLTMFFAGVYELVAGTLSIRNKIDESATPYAVAPVVLDRIVEDLRGTLLEPYKDLDVLRAESENMNGETCTKIDFVTVIPSRSRVKVRDETVKARINEVGYRLRRSETVQGLAALYRREDLGVDEEPLEGGRYYKLCDRVKVFRIDWFADGKGDPSSSDDAKGVEEWDAKKEKKLPFACRVTLTLVGDSQLDDRGRVDQNTPEYTFVTYVAFNARHDKGDQQRPP